MEHIGDSQENTQLEEVYDQKERFLREESPFDVVGSPTAIPSSVDLSTTNSRKRARSPESAAITGRPSNGGPSKRSHSILRRIKDEMAQGVKESVSEDLEKLQPMLETFHRKMLQHELHLLLGGEEGNRAEEEREAAVEQLLNDIRVVFM
jgi:hypothetical protein